MHFFFRGGAAFVGAAHQVRRPGRLTGQSVWAGNWTPAAGGGGRPQVLAPLKVCGCRAPPSPLCVSISRAPRGRSSPARRLRRARLTTPARKKASGMPTDSVDGATKGWTPPGKTGREAELCAASHRTKRARTREVLLSLARARACGPGDTPPRPPPHTRAWLDQASTRSHPPSRSIEPPSPPSLTGTAMCRPCRPAPKT